MSHYRFEPIAVRATVCKSRFKRHFTINIWAVRNQLLRANGYRAILCSFGKYRWTCHWCIIHIRDCHIDVVAPTVSVPSDTVKPVYIAIEAFIRAKL